jgi:hypothetical protein
LAFVSKDGSVARDVEGIDQRADRDTEVTVVAVRASRGRHRRDGSIFQQQSRRRPMQVLGLQSVHRKRGV